MDEISFSVLDEDPEKSISEPSEEIDDIDDDAESHDEDIAGEDDHSSRDLVISSDDSDKTDDDGLSVTVLEEINSSLVLELSTTLIEVESEDIRDGELDFCQLSDDTACLDATLAVSELEWRCELDGVTMAGTDDGSIDVIEPLVDNPIDHSAPLEDNVLRPDPLPGHQPVS